MAETNERYEFAIGDKVLAYYGGLLYEAKCIKRRISDDGETQYFVHYKGFKNSWDEWHNEVLEINAINLSHKERLENNLKASRKSKRVKKSQEPRTTEDRSSPKPVKRKRGRPKKNVEQAAGPAATIFAKPATTQFADPTSSQSAESTTNQCDEWSDDGDILAINQINVRHKERLSSRKNCKTLKRVKKSQEPRKIKDDSSKPALRKRGKPNKNVDQSAETAELSVGHSAEPAEAQSAEPSEAQSTEPALDQSAEPAVRQFAEPSVGQSAELMEGQSSESTLRQSAEPMVGQSSESSIAQSAISIVEDNSAEPSVAQSAIPIVEDNSAEPTAVQSEIIIIEDVPAEPSVTQSAIPIVEDRPAIVAVPNIVFNAIPSTMLLAKEMLKLKLPFNLKKVIEFDRKIMLQLDNCEFQRVLNFPEKNYFAEIIHAFTKSSYFTNDSEKKYSPMFCVTLMQYFNASVHKHLTYRVERKNNIKFKGLCYFKQRLKDQPNTNYVYKNLLRPKEIWCYLYGSIYLLRLIARFPLVLKSNTMLPGYDLNCFVHHIKRLIWFLEDNFNTFFTYRDYIKIEDMDKYVETKCS